MKNSVGAKLKKYRIERDVNQAEVAKKIGTSQTIISQIERGYVPSERVLHRIKKFLEAAK